MQSIGVFSEVGQTISSVSLLTRVSGQEKGDKKEQKEY